MDKQNYDLIIVGTGPAGYTASIYASRYKINHLLIGNLSGGQITEAHKVCNFPGEKEISGIELGFKMQKHAKNLGAEEITDTVTNIEQENNKFIVETQSGKKFNSKTILLAHGTKRRKLNLQNEDKFLGKGVSYCATCDAGFYKEKTVGVIGGSNAANTAALLLSDLAKKVYLTYRKNALRGDQMWIDQIHKKNNIEVVFNTNVIELIGEDSLEKVKLDNPYQNTEILNIDGLFIEIGSTPSLVFTPKLDIETTESGYIKTKPDQSTNIKGLFAAGDITTNSDNFRQVITACSEGAIAARNIYQYLSK